jgi:hypothetical protein
MRNTIFFSCLLLLLLLLFFFLSEGVEAIDWFITPEAVSLISQIDNSLPHRFFSGPNTYSSSSELGDITLTKTYQSFEAFKNDIENGVIGTAVKAVVYDSENWTFTPVEEQQNPKYYFQQFCQLAHQNGYLCILTPASDLVNALDSCYGETINDKYLNCSIAKMAAEVADILEIQAQGIEANTDLFFSFVQSADAQAKIANPNIILWAGLSTNPSGQNVTAKELYSAYKSTAGSIVRGYWLNIPGQSAYCPKCGTPKAQIAVDFLNMISSAASKLNTPLFSFCMTLMLISLLI